MKVRANDTLMLLIPMDGPDSTPRIVRCVSCKKHVHSSEAHADIKGEPFKAFYCVPCVIDLRWDSNVVTMTREEYFKQCL